MFTEYDQYDGLGLAQLVATGELSSAEVIATMTARIEALNPQLNAVVRLYEDELKRSYVKQGIFAGLPMLVKDLNLYVQGQVTANGSRLRKTLVAQQDSTLVARYRDAGMLIAGQTNSPEFGLSPTTEPGLNGATHNPWKLGYSCGGSSGGAAAAVASGMVPFAHASDGGGSIRIPASTCGIFGLKPSRGRISPAPHLGEGWNGLSTHHAVSRSVRDNAALLDISHGYAPGDPYAAPAIARSFLEETGLEPGQLRIAISTENPIGFPVDEDCVNAVNHAATLCESLGHSVEIAKPEYDHIAMSTATYTIISAHIVAGIREVEQTLGREASPAELEDLTRLMVATASEQTSMDYAQAQRVMNQVSRQLAAFWQCYDVYLTPVLGSPPQKHGDLIYKEGANFEDYGIQMATYCPFTGMANFTGQPSMSVPLYWNQQQLPIGVMFTGGYGDEGTLYRLAAQLERAQPWFERRPG